MRSMERSVGGCAKSLGVLGLLGNFSFVLLFHHLNYIRSLQDNFLSFAIPISRRHIVFVAVFRFVPPFSSACF
jgi:hypothetical protein